MNSNKRIKVNNPIIKADYPDPDIICVGDAFYYATTTMHFVPGGQILRSYNLKDWEIAGYVYDSFMSEEAKITNENTNYGCGMWAPSFRFHDGKFYYCFATKETQRTYIYSSASVEGPWDCVYFEHYYHDSSLFFDDDGRVFLVHGNTEIFLTEMLPDLSGEKPDGINKVILVEKDDVYLGLEGSHLYKIDGKYHLFNIHWPKKTSRRTQTCFSADTIDGEYTGGDIFDDDCGYMGAGIAQGGILQANNGKWYTVLMQDHGAVGRVPYLVPMKWVDGKPVIGEDGKVPACFEIPNNRPFYEYEPLYTSDDFKYVTDDMGHCCLKKQWQWNHVPNPKLWSIDFRGGLRITTDKICTNVTKAVNTLTQRFFFPKSSASVKVDASDLNEGDRAGLLALQGCYGFLAVSCELRRFYLEVIVRDKDKYKNSTSADFMPGKVVERISLNGPEVELKLECTFENGRDFVRFFYKDQRDKEKWREIGEPYELRFGLDHFMGTRAGLAVFSTKTTGGSALFKDFVFEYDEK